MAISRHAITTVRNNKNISCYDGNKLRGQILGQSQEQRRESIFLEGCDNFINVDLDTC